MANKNVVFLGNCQAEMVAGAVAKVFAPDTELHVQYYANYNLSEAGREQIAAALGKAHIVFTQRAQFDIKWITDLIPEHVPSYFFPALRLTFLWPDAEKVIFAGGGDEVDNSTPLAGMRASGMLARICSESSGLPREVASRYIRLDVARECRAERQAKLDRATQIHLSRDTDLNLWDAFEKTLPVMRPYFSPWHPDWSLLEPVLLYVVDVLGGAEAERVKSVCSRYTDENFFGKLSMPIHPSIAKMFDLKWKEEAFGMYNVRYGYADTQAYVRLYLQSPPSYEAFHKARIAKQNQRAVQAARRVVARRLGAPCCVHATLAELLADVGSEAEALEHCEQLLEQYAFDHRILLRVSKLAYRLKNSDLAERSRVMTEHLVPDNISFLHHCITLARSREDVDGVEQAAEKVLKRDPFDEVARSALGLSISVAPASDKAHWKIGRRSPSHSR